MGDVVVKAGLVEEYVLVGLLVKACVEDYKAAYDTGRGSLVVIWWSAQPEHS